jgi:hypothetical protein
MKGLHVCKQENLPTVIEARECMLRGWEIHAEFMEILRRIDQKETSFQLFAPQRVDPRRPG